MNTPKTHSKFYTAKQAGRDPPTDPWTKPLRKVRQQHTEIAIYQIFRFSEAITA